MTYEMLTAQVPFAGESSTAVIDQIVHYEPPALARLNYNVPQELERIIRKTLEKDPDFRYQSAREMYIDLRNLQRDLDSNNRTASVAHPITEHHPTALLADTRQVADATAAMSKLENARCGDDLLEYHRRARG